MYAAATNTESKSLGWPKNKPALVIVAFTALLIGFEAYTLAIVHHDERVALPDNIGNFERVRNSVSEQGPQEQFSFAVVGGMRGSRTFGRLCDELRGEPLSFMVILGGFVKTCTKSNHDFFRAECAGEYRLPFPVFLLAGDSDVVWEEAGYDIDKVSLTGFEKLYGPRNFSFAYNGCLFVGLAILPYPFPTVETIKFLDSTLAAHRDENQKVFVFTHSPAVSSAGPATDSFANVQAFMDVVDRYKVGYVICSSYKGDDRAKLKDTVYLATGASGSPLDKKEETFDGLYHAVVLTVDCDSVSERAVSARRGTGVTGTLKHFAMAELAPFLRKHPALAIVENVLVFGMFCMSLFGLIRSAGAASLAVGPRVGV